MRMPFWSDSTKENFKAKLEHKMCVAKETPEAIFDIADCNLSEVPPGVYSMCRVFRKEALLLQNNQLQSLQNGGPMKDLSHLLVLNLNNNKISSLPEEIGRLSQLKELLLGNNRLKKLPVSFSELKKLHHLNIKSNRFQQFPLILCNLPCLEVLNICDNKKLCALPKDVCNLVQLKTLELDVDTFIYPSSDICSGGTASIMEFLCKEEGKEYNPAYTNLTVLEGDTSDSSIGSESTWCTTDLSASFREYQRAKDQKRQELILMEEALKENDAMQAELAADASIRRQKLLEEFAQDQERMESEIMELQNKKEKERQNLFAVLIDIEDHSAKLVEQLMCLNEKNKNVEGLLEVLEQDRIENEEMFSVKQEELEQLRKKEILEAMTEMLQAEERQRQYESEKSNVIEKLQNSENESNIKLLDVFYEREQDQQTLMNRLLEEERYQKEAFEFLQLQKDMRHQEIIFQIKLIEKELSSLTLAELKKKDIRASFELNVLCENRTTLAYLLEELLAAKDKRERELKDRLKQMEHQRLDEMKDFWLIQYQKLLDSKPKELINAELTMDPFVKIILIEAGASHLLCLFATKSITWTQLLTFTAEDLKMQIGVLDHDLCIAILSKTREKLHQLRIESGMKTNIPAKKISPTSDEPANIPEPSAPPEPLSEATAPPLSPDAECQLWYQSECVICLDLRSSAVFLPCGHVCCCQNCSNTVEACPMCRATISTRFILTFS